MKPRNRLFLEELLGEKSPTPQEETVPRSIVIEAPVEAIPAMPRRSGRVVRQLDRYGVIDIDGDIYTGSSTIPMMILSPMRRLWLVLIQTHGNMP